MKLNEFADALNAMQKSKENPPIVISHQSDPDGRHEFDILDIIYFEGRIEILTQ